MRDETHSTCCADTTRRSFIGALWAAALGVASLALHSPLARAAKQVAIDIEKMPSLKEIGGSAYASIKKKKILFIRTSETQIAAIDPECTHQKCAVQYKKSWGEIRCSCHGSKFTKTGKVTNGPADKDLKTYPASIKDGKIVIKV